MDVSFIIRFGSFKTFKKILEIEKNVFFFKPHFYSFSNRTFILAPK